MQRWPEPEPVARYSKMIETENVGHIVPLWRLWGTVMRWNCLLFVIVGCALPPKFAPVQNTVISRAGLSIDLEPSREIDLTSPINMNRAASIALSNNPALAADLTTLSLSQADLLDASASSLHLGGELLFSDGELEHVEVDAVANITELIGIRMRRAAAKTRLRAAEKRAASRVLDTALSARLAFIEHRAEQSRLSVITKMSQALDAAQDLARRLHDAGNINDLDLLNHRAAASEARLSALQQEVRVQATRATLATQLGLSAGSKFAMGRSLRSPQNARLKQVPAIKQTVELCRERNLELRAMGKDALAAKRELRVARFRGFPQLEAGIVAEREQQHWSVGPAFELTIPLGRWAGSRLRARALRTRAEFAGQAMQIHLDQQVRATHARLQRARRRLEEIETSLLPTRRQALDESLRMYNGMFIGTFQLLSAFQALLSAENKNLDALRAYWQARVVIEHLMAGGSPPNGWMTQTPSLDVAQNKMAHGGH